MIIASNFKMNHTRASTASYLQKLGAYKKPQNVSVYIFPPFTALDRYEGSFTIGAQDAYPAQKGSFTGEIGLEQLQEFGIDSLIVGHSERRHIIGEHQDFIAKKFDFYKKRGFTIFYCIGETAEVKESGSKELIFAYLQEQLEGIDLQYENLVLAYEPVWAIGTGKSATPADIEEILAFLQTLTDRPLLYGGSVNPDNIASILSLDGCSGALIGTASWDVEKMIEMIEIAKEI